MVKRNIQALFFDIDGTLASPGTHMIHPKDIRSFRRLHELGYRLFIATGRDLSIPNEAEIIDPVIPYISGFIDVNGQHCTLSDSTEIYSCPIADEDFLPLRVICEEHHFSMLYRVDHTNYLTDLTDQVRRYWAQMGLPIPVIRPMDPDIHNIPKLCVHCSQEEESTWLSPVLNHTWTARITNDLIDLIPNGIGKSTGIREICAHFGISVEQTMAFGDGQNDMDMLRAVGISVAMGNGAENVKAIADYVTVPAADAGITHALEHFKLL